MKINYFDLGLYRGEEIDYMIDLLPKFSHNINIYGFEVNKEYYNRLKQKYKDKEYIKIYNYAICNLDNENIKIYKSTTSQGNSIYSSKHNALKEYYFCQSKKFSTFIKNNNINLDDSFNIIKINIEGAEYDFFNDIIIENIYNKINIFLGDGARDIYKIDELKDKTDKFFNLLKEKNIIIHHFINQESERENNVNIMELIKSKW